MATAQAKKEFVQESELLQKIGFTSSLIKQIYVDLIERKTSLIQFVGDEVNYETMCQVQAVGCYYTEQGATVLTQFDSKNITIAVKIV